jgi:hypothetical protein
VVDKWLASSQSGDEFPRPADLGHWAVWHLQLDGGMLDPMWKKGTRIRIWLLGLDWQSLPDDATA